MSNLFTHHSRTTILNGDVRDLLPSLPSDHFDCVVTSPPYWGLRDYGVEGQIGLEPTLGEHLSIMVNLFNDVRRVLKPTGTCWINYGDCYATTPNGRSAANTKTAGKDDRTFRDKPFSTIQGVLKPKDLCMVSNRLAIALQEDGWYVRSEIIWHKPNPMPESVKDRPTSAHEKVWLLTKSEKYFYDDEAIKEQASGRVPGNKNPSRVDASRNDSVSIIAAGQKQWDFRNARNVWSIPTKSFKGAHFATMPPELAERCIKAGCPVGGVVLDPFGGAGTTGLVANQLQRNATLIELNTEYVDLAQQRIEAAE